MIVFVCVFEGYCWLWAHGRWSSHVMRLRDFRLAKPGARSACRFRAGASDNTPMPIVPHVWCGNGLHVWCEKEPEKKLGWGVVWWWALRVCAFCWGVEKGMRWVPFWGVVGGGCSWLGGLGVVVCAYCFFAFAWLLRAWRFGGGPHPPHFLAPSFALMFHV